MALPYPCSPFPTAALSVIPLLHPYPGRPYPSAPTLLPLPLYFLPLYPYPLLLPLLLFYSTMCKVPLFIINISSLTLP